jgi:ribonuclease HII
VACTSRFERKALQQGFRLVAGLDEAGRGCLFGPVYAAAVILDPARPIRGLNDSKQLTPTQRETLAPVIRARCIAWSVASVDAAIIDRINIYQASRLAMRLALEKLQPQPDYLLVDALAVETPISQEALIHGDARCRSIAAASVLAKVERDANMEEWDRIYPHFGFRHHKGYSTPQHLEALAQHGPTPHHRFSYEPVRAAGDAGAQLTLFAEA